MKANYFPHNTRNQQCSLCCDYLFVIGFPKYALGHKRTLLRVRIISALPPKDGVIGRRCCVACSPLPLMSLFLISPAFCRAGWFAGSEIIVNADYPAQAAAEAWCQLINVAAHTRPLATKVEWQNQQKLLRCTVSRERFAEWHWPNHGGGDDEPSCSVKRMVYRLSHNCRDRSDRCVVANSIHQRVWNLGCFACLRCPCHRQSRPDVRRH